MRNLWQGIEFYAQRRITRFCCKHCNDIAYKKSRRLKLVQKVESEIMYGVSTTTKGEDIRNREYLTINQTMRLLGVSRRSVYNLFYSGALKAYQPSLRKTIIRRAELEAMMDSNPYQRRHKQEEQPIVEFYTAVEILEKYGISHAYLYKLANKLNFPRVLKRGTTYWSKKHIDTYFAKHAPDSSITEWYTVQEIMDKYGMTQAAAYCMVSDNSIPKRKEKRYVYYSKKHVDELKQKQSDKETAEPEYYSVKEAMAKYHLTRDQMYHYCRYHNIPKVTRGKYTFIEKTRFDEVLSVPVIP